MRTREEIIQQATEKDSLKDVMNWRSNLQGQILEVLLDIRKILQDGTRFED